MRLFGRRQRGAGRTACGGSTADLAHLAQFATSRPGVEAYLEPRTAVTEWTVLLVAGTGEWTRRRVRDPQQAFRFAQEYAIPFYEAQRVGYPARMRSWTARQSAAQRAGASESGGRRA